MKQSFKSKGLVIVTLIAVVGFSAYAFADWGMGYGRYGMGMQGGGMGYGGRGWDYHGSYRGHGPHSGRAYMGNLSEDEIKKLDQQRTAFLKDTETPRQDVYAKELALRSELAKQNPDAQKAANLQKEISQLESRLDQKRVDHMIQMRKTNPDPGRGYMGRGGMGYGMMGPGRGYDMGRGGYCGW